MNTLIEVHHLSFGFAPDRPVLRDVSFSLGAGEHVGVLGANGAGKSTLVECLLGLHPVRGTVRLFGRSPGRGLWKRVGVVFQNPEDLLFMPTLLGDLMLPLRNRGVAAEEALATARAALRRMGLEDFESVPAQHLSLGQRKRAAIAAALVGSPQLLILDEPTAELDGRSTRRLAELLHSLALACLITSHHLEFLERVTGRLLVLHHGTVVADGETARILADRELLTRAELL